MPPAEENAVLFSGYLTPETAQRAFELISKLIEGAIFVTTTISFEIPVPFATWLPGTFPEFRHGINCYTNQIPFFENGLLAVAISFMFFSSLGLKILDIVSDTANPGHLIVTSDGLYYSKLKGAKLEVILIKITGKRR